MMEDLHQLSRYAAFGAICGSMTGLTVGAVDSFRLFRRGQDVQVATRTALNEMARSGILMASFFAGYQCIKCGLSRPFPDDRDAPTLVMLATSASLAPFAVLAPLRRLIPYAGTLIAVDVYHTYFGASKRRR